MFDGTTPKYAALYARWLANVDRLLDAGPPSFGQRVIDLAGGTCELAKLALVRGALQAVVVDLAPRLRNPYNRLTVITGRAEKLDELLLEAGQREADGYLRRDQANVRAWYADFDAVYCRQAIGYLDVDLVARAVARVLKPGGHFVFNTFVKPKWAFKRYWFSGRPFVEASGFLGNTVWHIQASPTIGVDVTRFKWHREADLDRALAPFFSVKKTKTDTTLTYVCRTYDRIGEEFVDG